MATTAQNRRDLYPDIPANNAATDVDVYTTPYITSRLQRVSWGAIFAGIVISLVTMLALNMLGLSIGAATINPAYEPDAVDSSLATGSIIWMIASNLIALFLGGYTAGYLSRSTNQMDGILHGLTTWGVVTLISFALITTSVGGVVSGVVNAASQALATAGGVAAQTAPAFVTAADNQNNVLSTIGAEVQNMLPPMNNTAATTGTNGTTTNENTGTTAATTASIDQIEIMRAVTNLFSQDNITDADRQEVANLIADRTGMSAADVNARLARWEEVYTQVREDAAAAVRDASQKAADAVTLLTGAMFAAFIAGAFAAGAGGLVGLPEPARDRRTVDSPPA